MTPDMILALYEWELGDCFRCGDADLFVTHLDGITTPRGEEYRLCACGGCVLALEAERRRFAQRKGVEYRPGMLGAA